MGVQLPYAVELQVVRYRQHATVNDTAAKFGISRNAVIRITKRHADLVERVRRELEDAAVAEMVADALEVASYGKEETASESP